MFSSAFRRALNTVAIHSSSTDSLDSVTYLKHPTDIVEQHHFSEPITPTKAPVNSIVFEEAEGESFGESSDRLGSIESLSYKALPDLPLSWDSGTSSKLQHKQSSTSVATETLTGGQQVHDLNDSGPTSISVSISQIQSLPSNVIETVSPPSYNGETQAPVTKTKWSYVRKPLVEAPLPNDPIATSSTPSSPTTESCLPDKAPITILDTNSIIEIQLSPSSIGPNSDVPDNSTTAVHSGNERDIAHHTHPKSHTSRDPLISKLRSDKGSKMRKGKSTSSFPTFLHNIAEINADLSAEPPQAERGEEEETKRRKRPPQSFPVLQPIVESNSSTFSTPNSAPSKSFISPVGSNIRGLDASFARKMEEAGRLRRLQSQNSLKSGIQKAVSVSETSDPEQQSSAEPHSHLKSYSEDDAKAEGRMLRDLLDRTLRELKDTREEAERVTAQITWEKSRLVQELKSSNEDVRNLLSEKEAQRQTITTLRSELKTKDTELNALMKEKKTWQGQLDTMHHKVVHADRRIRFLDNLTQSKIEARMEGAFGPTRRSATARAATSKTASAEVVGAVVALNEEILQASNILVEILERSLSTASNASILRAKTVVGNTITSMMQTQGAERITGFRFLLTQVTLESFMVYWCTNIIEGWYPRRQSFADLLIDLSANTSKPGSAQPPSANANVDCGKVKILEMTTSMADKFPEWVSEIIQDLWQILSAAGLRLKPSRRDTLTSKLLMIVKMAYDIRTALAEKDICGDLEIAVVSPDYPFQEKWMDEAHHDTASRKDKSSSRITEVDLVASTSGLGLKRSPADDNGKNSTSNMVMILKPKVVLARVLEDSM